MLTDWLSKLSFLANPLENNCFNRGFSNTSTKIYSTIFDRFQLAVNNFFHAFEIKISCTIVILIIQ